MLAAAVAQAAAGSGQRPSGPVQDPARSGGRRAGTGRYLSHLGILSEAINHMLHTFAREYLVERIDGIVEHREITGYYPRLTLAARQRFASKGGCLVRFADANSARVVADGEWIVP